MTYDTERTIAREAARLAGQLCLAVRGGMLNSPESMEKDGREPVTIADFGAQAVVLQHIARHFPADAAVAEEHAADFERLASDAQRERIIYYVSQALGRPVSPAQIAGWLDYGRERSCSRVWTVDPIDGTKGFLRGDQFAIAVALLVDGQPVVGALACPLLPFGSDGAADARGIIAVAVRAEGATIEPLSGGPVRPLRVSDRAEVASARSVESVEVGHTDHSFSAAVFQTAGVGGQPVRMDSQTKYVAVADGRAEIYIRNSRGADYREKIWDHAAGVLVVQEAGGRVTDLNGSDLDFSLGAKLQNNRGILATNGLLHDVLLEAIRAHN